MNRTKLVKFSIPLVIAIVLLGCLSNVNAWGHRGKVTYRSLDDWAEKNPSIFYAWRGAPSGQEIPLYRLMLADFFNGIPPPEGTYNGFILERELQDGRTEVTVHLFLYTAPFGLMYMDGRLIFEEGSTKIGFYHEVFKFYIPEPGALIPNLGQISTNDWISIFIWGWGYGTFTNDAEGFTPGAKGMFSILMYGYPEDGVLVWPYGIIDVFELC